MNVRLYIRGALWTGAFLLVALLVSASLWLVLAAAGDQAGSQGAKGVAFVAVICAVLDLVALVVLLALAELARSEPPPREPPADSPR